jgi:hypothetical protein
MSQELFHQSTLATTDDESFALSPVGNNGVAIAQTSDEAVLAMTTGVFEASFLFNPVINLGAAPVGVGQWGKPNPVGPARFYGSALLYPEMVVSGNLLGKGDLKSVLKSGFSFPPMQAVAANNTTWELGKLESSKNAVGFNAIDKGLPVILSAHHFDSVSNPAQISNTSIIERMWRNTHQGSVLDYLYEGDTARPSWIVPLKKPFELIDCGNEQDAIKRGLEQTRPGTNLTRSFWPL